MGGAGLHPPRVQGPRWAGLDPLPHLRSLGFIYSHQSSVLGLPGLAHPSWAVFSQSHTPQRALKPSGGHREAWGSSLMSPLHNFLLLGEL